MLTCPYSRQSASNWVKYGPWFDIEGQKGKEGTNEENIRMTWLFKVANGQEPSHTHDMDDDDIDEMEEIDTNSDQSN